MKFDDTFNLGLFQMYANYMKSTVSAEKSLSLNLGLFGFERVATEFKLSLITSFNI